MIENLNSVKHVLFVLALVYLCLLITSLLQGLDFLDHGYWLSAYQQFISYPEGIGNVAMASWGTLAIGHIWHLYFGSLGLMAFKLAYIAEVLVIFIVAYHTLKNIYSNNRTILLLVIFVTLLFITKKIGIIGYNNLTALFYLLGGVMIFHSLKKQNKSLMFLAGLILGFNVFIRVPNILGILLITVIGLHAYVERWQINKAFNFSIIFIAGFSLAIVFVLLFMQHIGHLVHYLDSLKEIFGLHEHAASEHHSLGLLVFLLFRDYLLSFFSGAVCILTAIIFAKKITYILFKTKWLIIFLLSIVSIPVLGFEHIGDWLIPGIINIVLLILLFFQVKSKAKLASLTYVALATIVLAPLGSNNGMWNAIYGMWLALPLTIMTIYQLGDISWKGVSIKRIEIKTIYQTLITVILVYSLATVFTSTYHDSRNRFKMTYGVGHPLLENIFTTRKRAIVVQELLNELVKHVKKDDYLLAYNKVPMLHYLTNTRPWLGDSWPLNHPFSVLQEFLDKKSNSDEVLPVIVRALGDTSDRNWPQQNNSIEDNYHAPAESRELLDRFISKNNYQSIWKNSFFEILSNGL